jgi:hypothetical protein
MSDTTSSVASGETLIARLAQEIARDLFTNGQRQRADRLVLTIDGPPKLDLGGWSEAGATDRVRGKLTEALSSPREGRPMSDSKALAVAALVMAGAVVRIELRKTNNPQTDEWWLGHLDTIAVLLKPSPREGAVILTPRPIEKQDQGLPVSHSDGATNQPPELDR